MSTSSCLWWQPAKILTVDRAIAEENLDLPKERFKRPNKRLPVVWGEPNRSQITNTRYILFHVQTWSPPPVAIFLLLAGCTTVSSVVDLVDRKRALKTVGNAGGRTKPRREMSAG